MNQYLCIDIGGTTIKYGIYNDEGEKIQSLQPDWTDNSLEKHNILNTLYRKIDSILPKYNLSGLCISSAGVVDSKQGSIIYAGYTIPNYSHTPLKKKLEQIFKIPCEIENDVNAACLGEFWKGALRETKSGVCMTIGTGVGGAILLGNQIFHGMGYTAGEIGYLTIEGHKFQDLASTSALVRRVNKRMQDSLNGEQIFELAKKGNTICIEEIDFLIKYLSTGITSIMYLLNPEKIVLGGGIMAQEEYLKPRIQDKINQTIQNPIFAKTEIKFAELKNDAGMVGALYNFKKRH